MLSNAITITANAFNSVKDKHKEPYILHCLTVMFTVKPLGEDYAIVGVLHDLIENTSWTIPMLIASGFNKKVTTAVDLLIYILNISYQTYIEVLAKNPIALEVKLADLRHNSDITRSLGMKNLEKYHKAYAYLIKEKNVGKS